MDSYVNKETWRKIFSWQVMPPAELFSEVGIKNKFPTPEKELALPSEQQLNELREMGFYSLKSMKRDWKYLLLKKLDEHPDQALSLAEMGGVGKVRWSLEYGLVNLVDGMLTISQKGRDVYDTINNRFIPLKEQEAYTLKFFQNVYDAILAEVRTADVTDVFTFFPRVRRVGDCYVFGGLSTSFLQYVARVERYAKANFGKTIAKTLDLGFRPTSAGLAAELAADYFRSNESKVIDQFKLSYPRVSITPSMQFGFDRYDDPSYLYYYGRNLR